MLQKRNVKGTIALGGCAIMHPMSPAEVTASSEPVRACMRARARGLLQPCARVAHNDDGGVCNAGKMAALWVIFG